MFNAFEVGGVERQHMMLVERLQPEFDQVCWSFGHGPIEEELKKLLISYYIGSFSAVESILKENKFDCIVVRTNRYLNQMVPELRRIDTPVIYIKDYLRWFEGNGTYLDSNCDSIACSMANAGFYCGPMLESGMIKMHEKGLVPELMYNGLDLARFPLKPRKSPQGPVIRIGMLGNIIQRKNQLAAIETLSGMLTAGECTLEIGGAFQDTKYLSLLKQHTHDLPITFHGYIADPVPFLMKIDLLLMTSKIEGWPVALMEGMACGLPVIAPDIGDIARLLKHGKSGFVFPDGKWEKINPLIENLRNTKLYEKISSNAIEWVRQFDIEICASQLRRAINRGIQE